MTACDTPCQAQLSCYLALTQNKDSWFDRSTKWIIKSISRSWAANSVTYINFESLKTSWFWRQLLETVSRIIFGQSIEWNVDDCPGILSDVLRHNQKSGKVEWRVLVVDKFSIKILNSTIKMHQLSAEGITREVHDWRGLLIMDDCSCGDSREAEGANAKHGSNIFHNTYWGKHHTSDEWF